MTWDEVCEDPSLRDLPYKIETNRFGQIVMSPHKIAHSRRQSRIEQRLQSLMESGEAMQEAAMETSDGIKAPDVVWASDELLREVESNTSGIFERAPEICVEVMSRSNPLLQMQEKMRLYFDKGAKEVWICDQKGMMHFYTAAGELNVSQLCPNFPLEIRVP